MMRRIYMGILMLFIFEGYAQPKLLTSIKLRQPVKQAYIDRPGDLYLQFNSGEINKYDQQGKLIETFRSSENITHFEPRDGARAFVYSRSGKWYSYAYFGSFDKKPIGDEFAIEPWLVTSSGDLNYWILDVADFTLKRIDTQRSTVETEAFISSHLNNDPSDYVTLREYQGFLFLLNRKSGIMIFNAMGKRLKILPGNDIPYFNFMGEELYYPQKDKLVFYDLFDGSERTEQLDAGIQFQLLSDERVYKIFADRVDIYPIRP